MVTIKLKRIGKKHQASFRIVVIEKRTKLQGRSTEDLGWIDPRAKKEEINKERVKYWLSVGAQPTPTVWNLLVRTGIVEGKKIPVHKKAKAGKEGEGAAAPAASAVPAPADAGALADKPAAPAEEKPVPASSSEATEDKEDSTDKPAA